MRYHARMSLFVHRLRASSLLLLSLAACRDEFDDGGLDPIVGTWELVEIQGFEGCALTEGELEIVQANDRSFSGDFEVMATCAMGEDLWEIGDVTDIEVDEIGRDYGIDIRLTMPDGILADWDCTMNDPELTCIESGAPPLVFEFEREGG